MKNTKTKKVKQKKIVGRIMNVDRKRIQILGVIKNGVKMKSDDLILESGGIKSDDLIVITKTVMGYSLIKHVKPETLGLL